MTSTLVLLASAEDTTTDNHVDSIPLPLSTMAKAVDPAICWRWWRSIGSPRHIVAPMVNQSELPYRLLTRRYNAHLTYTPMLHAALFARDAKYRAEHFQTDSRDAPLIAQFCGNSPDTILAAAKHIQDRVAAIDINLGCPQGIARRGHYGSFLLEDFALIRAIVTTLHNNLNVPVTCKIRILPSAEQSIALARLIADSGASMITVHGRTRECIKDRIGACDFDTIRLIKQSVNIPVVANGGISDYADVKWALDYTGADGVMTSEAILENPALFADKHVEPIAIAKEYLDITNEVPTPAAAIRPHLFKFLFTHLTVHTDMRDWLAKAKHEDLWLIVAELQRRHDAMTLDERQEVFAQSVSWYDRHRRKTPVNVAAITTPKSVDTTIIKSKLETVDREDDGVYLDNMFSSDTNAQTLCYAGE